VSQETPLLTAVDSVGVETPTVIEIEGYSAIYNLRPVLRFSLQCQGGDRAHILRFAVARRLAHAMLYRWTTP
jgi:hypothetical protein